MRRGLSFAPGALLVITFVAAFAVASRPDDASPSDAATARVAAPVAVKPLHAVAALPTTASSRLRAALSGGGAAPTRTVVLPGRARLPGGRAPRMRGLARPTRAVVLRGRARATPVPGGRAPRTRAVALRGPVRPSHAVALRRLVPRTPAVAPPRPAWSMFPRAPRRSARRRRTHTRRHAATRRHRRAARRHAETATREARARLRFLRQLRIGGLTRCCGEGSAPSPRSRSSARSRATSQPATASRRRPARSTSARRL